MSVTDLTVKELSDKLAKSEISSVEITEEYLKRIESADQYIQAFITVTADLAREQAQQADARRSRGEALGVLDGIPMALKDNFCTNGVRTTCASKILENFIPPYDATVTKKLKEQGAVLLGKCNMDEFAMGSSTETSAFFPTKNPFNTAYVPGGSSGGSAAALAGHLAPYTLGSDTGGSIRQPASFCGVVGFKPTYGRVSRFGIVPYASSLDQVGVFAKNTYDCATVLTAISGKDQYDSTSAEIAVPDYAGNLGCEMKGIKVGIAQEYFMEGVDPRIVDKVLEAAKVLQSLGAELVDISLPHTAYALSAYYVLATAEASSNLERYDGVRYGYRSSQADNLKEMFKATRSEGFGAEVKRRIMLGTYVLSSGYYDAYYNKTLQVRTLVKKDYDEAFQQVDCLLTPTAPTVAFKLGEKTADPLTMYMSDICTVSTNLAGLAGLSIPFGMVDNLPVGVQLLGAPFSEQKLLQIAFALESNSDQTILQAPDVLQGGNK